MIHDLSHHVQSGSAATPPISDTVAPITPPSITTGEPPTPPVAPTPKQSGIEPLFHVNELHPWKGIWFKVKHVTPTTLVLVAVSATENYEKASQRKPRKPRGRR